MTELQGVSVNIFPASSWKKGDSQRATSFDPGGSVQQPCWWRQGGGLNFVDDLLCRSCDSLLRGQRSVALLPATGTNVRNLQGHGASQRGTGSICRRFRRLGLRLFATVQPPVGHWIFSGSFGTDGTVDIDVRREHNAPFASRFTGRMDLQRAEFKIVSVAAACVPGELKCLQHAE